MRAADFYGRFVENPPIHDEVFSHFQGRQLETIIAFSRTSRGGYKAVQKYMARVFNIDRHLLRFFFTYPQVRAFRSLQARTGTLISGSNALQFMDRCYYPDSDLDLYCESRYAAEVGRWLQQCAGYEFRPNSSQAATFEDAYAASTEEFVEHRKIYEIQATALTYNHMRGVDAVFNFFKRSDSGGSELKVQLLSSTACAMEVIINFHSTVVMNVISFSTAYSLFPRSTFFDRESLVISTAGPRQEAARRKYAKRGYDMIVTPSLRKRLSAHSSFRKGIRWIGDALTWTLPLDTRNIGLSSAASGVPLTDGLPITRWKLQYGHDIDAMMVYGVLSSLVLKYCYLTPNSTDASELPTILARMQDVTYSFDMHFDTEVAELCKAPYRFHVQLNDVALRTKKQMNAQLSLTTGSR